MLIYEEGMHGRDGLCKFCEVLQLTSEMTKQPFGHKADAFGDCFSNGCCKGEAYLCML